MTFRIITIALALLWLAMMPAAAQTLRIAHPVQLAPIIDDKDGKTVGLVVDILEAAAAHEGIDITFVPQTDAALGDMLKDGSADAIAPMPINSAVYDFTTPIFTTGGALFVRAPSATPTDLASLSGKTVVTPANGPFVAYFQKNYPNIRVLPTSKSTMTNEYEESLNDVMSGRADAAALNIQVGTGVVTASYAGQITVPTTMFVQTPLGLAVIKGQHGDVLNRLDAGLAAIQADGTLQRIEDQWKGR
jgi:ABC-type amino acid transport substrate-binding protein